MRSLSDALFPHRSKLKAYPYALEIDWQPVWPQPHKVSQRFAPQFYYVPLFDHKRRFYFFEREIDRAFFATTFKIPLTIPEGTPFDDIADRAF